VVLVFVRPNSSYVRPKLEVIGQMSCQVKYLFAALILYSSYDFQIFRSSLKDEWYRNAQTEIVSFPEEICLKLLLLLNENNKIQPPSFRTANGFNVSLNFELSYSSYTGCVKKRLSNVD
jgi:hypothetical protein